MKAIFDKLRVLDVVLKTTIMDYENLFSSGQAITATANSTNDVDLGGVAQDGDGSGRKVGIYITETFATLTDLTLSLAGSDTAADALPTTVISLAAVTLASGGLAAGQRYEIPIPANFGYRYATVVYTVGGLDATAGKVDAGVVLAMDTNS